jgi:hypothetical protein
MMSPAETECAHEACACMVLHDNRYCSEYCRAQDEIENSIAARDPDQLRAVTQTCDCGHVECDRRVARGKATHEQAR